MELENLDDFIETDEMEINKEVNTLSNDTIIKYNKDLMTMLEKKEKKTKKMVPVYLTEDILDKLKTVAYEKNLSVANVLETIVIELTHDIEINKKSVKKYDEAKGNRGKKQNK